jgi:hypothetical protein
MSGLVFFLIVNILIFPVKLPRLGNQKAIPEEDDEA